MFSGAVKGADQRVYLADKLRDLPAHLLRRMGVAQRGRKMLSPVALDSQQRCLLTIAHRGLLQLIAPGGALHLVKHVGAGSADRDGGEQTIALHAQRPGFVDSMRAALNALRQPARQRHAPHAEAGEQ